MLSSVEFLFLDVPVRGVFGYSGNCTKEQLVGWQCRAEGAATLSAFGKLFLLLCAWVTLPAW